MDLAAEWLEADGLGGFASGTVSGERTRRYHALLLAATHPPAGRVVLVNGIEVWVETATGRHAISTQRYLPNVAYPEGWRCIADFAHQPLAVLAVPAPRRHRRRAGGVRRSRRRRDGAALAPHRRQRRLPLDCTAVALGPGLSRAASGERGDRARRRRAGRQRGLAPLCRAARHRRALSNGVYRAAPDWYRGFLYTAERDRGLDHVEDLASPGSFAFDLAQDEAVLTFRVGDGLAVQPIPHAATLAAAERRRREALPDALAVSADAFVVDGAGGQTLLAGFPWFTDWGRDTFIAMRGLLLATGRLREAGAILATWAGMVSAGMLPNRRSDVGDVLDYNTVDAALWFVVAVEDFLREAAGAGYAVRVEARLAQAVADILEGYAGGTRYGIGLDADGLLRAGEPGVQLTWMDAKLGDWVVTPRIGKPVEVEALWINALRIARRWSSRWTEAERAARAAFACRFPNPANGGLFDVVDADHVPGRNDARIRPNQIFAVGGLPYSVLDDEPARGVVDLAADAARPALARQ